MTKKQHTTYVAPPREGRTSTAPFGLSMVLQAADSRGGPARAPFLKEKWRLSGRTDGESFNFVLGLFLSLFPQLKALRSMIPCESLTGTES